MFTLMFVLFAAVSTIKSKCEFVLRQKLYAYCFL